MLKLFELKCQKYSVITAIKLKVISRCGFLGLENIKGAESYEKIGGQANGIKWSG